MALQEIPTYSANYAPTPTVGFSGLIYLGIYLTWAHNLLV